MCSMFGDVSYYILTCVRNSFFPVYVLNVFLFSRNPVMFIDQSGEVCVTCVYVYLILFV